MGTMLRNRCDVGRRASSRPTASSRAEPWPDCCVKSRSGRRRALILRLKRDPPSGRQSRARVARLDSEVNSAFDPAEWSCRRKRDAPQRCLVGVTWSVVAPLDVCGGAFGPIVRPVVSAATAPSKLAAAFAALTDLGSRRNFLPDPAGNRCPLAFPVRVSCP
jgi:hypothetical protein